MLAKSRSFLFALGLSVMLAAPSAAQTSHMHLGARLNYDATNSRAGVGVQFSAPIASHLEFYPSFDLFFPDAGSQWTVNFDLKYRFAHEHPNWWYLGAGVAVDHSSFGDVSHDDAGLNLFLGVEPLKGKIHPFAEARMTAQDGSRFGILLGVNITLGKGHN